MALSTDERQRPLPGSRIETLEPAVLIRDVHVFLGDARVPILDLENLRVQRGERVVVLGPSGAGKTTLLRMINSYVAPTGGVVRVLGAEITPQRGLDRRMKRHIGFVFQGFNLIPRASVFDNVLWGRLGRMGMLSIAGVVRRADREAALAALEEVELADLRDRRVDRLSGGEQQRVGIARVIAQEAELVLADEPVSNLDPELADEILDLLVALCGRPRRTLIVSLHVPETARQYGERIVGLRRGKVTLDVAPAELTERDLRLLYQRPQPLTFDSYRAAAAARRAGS